MSLRGLLLLGVVLGGVGLGLILRTLTPVAEGPSLPIRPRTPRPPPLDYETWARKKFQAENPNEKPLNWAIAEVAERFHGNEPMGRFVLHENDCSDFVECVIDEALGAQARFKRGSQTHRIGERVRACDYWYWKPGRTVQPGDVIHIQHSPWYAPQEGSIGHVGVVGPDGKVYDFTKLRRWSQARYGRNDFEWFVRHCPQPREVLIGRLKPSYRYRVKPLPQRKDTVSPES